MGGAYPQFRILFVATDSGQAVLHVPPVDGGETSAVRPSDWDLFPMASAETP